MTGYLLSPAAQADLEQIWDYTARNWGKDQAARYILGIRDACQALADGRRQGRPIDDIRPGYRKLAVGSHVLFYRLFYRVADAGLIDVIRILHQRMDVAAHLQG
jgi:toxin ParE1/3/4